MRVELGLASVLSRLSFGKSEIVNVDLEDGDDLRGANALRIALRNMVSRSVHAFTEAERTQEPNMTGVTTCVLRMCLGR